MYLSSIYAGAKIFILCLAKDLHSHDIKQEDSLCHMCLQRALSKKPILCRHRLTTPCLLSKTGKSLVSTASFIIPSGISEVCSSETNSPTGDESMSVKRVNNQVFNLSYRCSYVLFWWLDRHQFCNLALATHVATYQHRWCQLQPRFSVEALVNLSVKGHANFIFNIAQEKKFHMKWGRVTWEVRE
jgi:hypothetical protein